MRRQRLFGLTLARFGDNRTPNTRQRCAATVSIFSRREHRSWDTGGARTPCAADSRTGTSSFVIVWAAVRVVAFLSTWEMRRRWHHVFCGPAQLVVTEGHQKSVYWGQCWPSNGFWTWQRLWALQQRNLPGLWAWWAGVADRTPPLGRPNSLRSRLLPFADALTSGRVQRKILWGRALGDGIGRRHRHRQGEQVGEAGPLVPGRVLRGFVRGDHPGPVGCARNLSSAPARF